MSFPEVGSWRPGRRKRWRDGTTASSGRFSPISANSFESAARLCGAPRNRERRRSDVTPSSITSAAVPVPPRSLQMVAPLRSGRRIAALLIGLVTLAALILIYVPWQQTVIGHGQVMVYSAMDRPQNVEAQIPGRLVEWRVQEGDL